MNYKEKILSTFWMPIAGLFYLLFWYAKHIDGIDPKSGQQYYKHKTIDGKTFFKKEGLKNIFSSWKECKTSKTIKNLDVNSFYSTIITNEYV